MKRFILFLVIQTMLWPVSRDAMAQSQLAEIDAYIVNEMQMVNKPGLAACIIKDDSIVWQGNYGYAILEDSLPVTDSTLFNAFSIGKSLTAACVMQLWEDSLLTLDEDVNGFLPFQIDNPYVWNDSISARMLMSHSSSIIDHDFYSYVTVGDPAMTLENFLENYLSPEGIYYSSSNFYNGQPGTFVSYCNIGSGLNGLLAEALTGMDFKTYAHENLLNPLDMNRSAWTLAEVNLENLAVGYQYSGNQYIPYAHYGHPAYPGVSLRSNASELSRYALMLLNDGLYDGIQVLEAATIDTMMTPQAPSAYYGLGLNKSDIWNYHGTFQREINGHRGGGQYGYAGEMWICKNDNTAVVYLSNSSTYLVGVTKKLFDYAAMFVISLPAVDIDLQSFKAVWESAPDASGYFLDVATDENFEEIVGDYLDKDVGADTCHLVTGLESDHAYYYRLRSYNDLDTGAYSNTVAVPIFTDSPELRVPPSGLQVEVFPNPFAGIANIAFQTGNASLVRIRVFNAMGGLVIDLSDSILTNGKHHIIWNAAELPAGLYFCRVQAGGYNAVVKVIKQ